MVSHWGAAGFCHCGGRSFFACQKSISVEKDLVCRSMAFAERAKRLQECVLLSIAACLMYKGSAIDATDIWKVMPV
eukprot:2838973-Amphidinium_carterae.2